MTFGRRPGLTFGRRDGLSRTTWDVDVTGHSRTAPGPPNGNTVSLEDQMMRSADARQSHDLALGVYRKTMDIMRNSLGRN